MSEFSIHLFGVPEVRVAAEASGAAIGHSALSLLAYIALSGPVVLQRETIAADLWPDCPPERVRARFSTALWRLRGALGGSPAALDLRADGALGLGTALRDRVDAIRFEACARRFVAAPGPGTASELMATLDADRARGEPLAGWTEDWALRIRVRLEDLHERCLMGLAEYLAAEGRDEAALDAAERLIAIDPLREDAHELVMRLHLRRGHPALARRQYARCRAALRDALGLDPSPECAALVGFGADEPAPEPAPSHAPSRRSLIAGDLAELRRAVAEAQQGLTRLSHRIDRIILR
jgi:DNA-binding SARP family transcriptional activator